MGQCILKSVRFHFTAEQSLPYPQSLVFAFFANPENLPRLMPRWQHVRMEQASFAAPPPRPEGTPRYAATAAGAGSRITISFRAVPLVPIRLPWEALIEDFVWNESFSDIQVRGPFKYWRHTHTIRPNSESSVIISDNVAYELPLGPLSGIANTLFVRPQLARTFRYRQQRTAELLAGAAKIQSP